MVTIYDDKEKILDECKNSGYKYQKYLQSDKTGSGMLFWKIIERMKEQNFPAVLLYCLRKGIEKHFKEAYTPNKKEEDAVMNTENRDIVIVITAMKAVMGIELIKQVLCAILLIFGVEEKRIMAELNVSYNTIKKYSRLQKSGEIAKLFENKKYKRKSEMEAYREEIMDELDKNPARTLREAAYIIEKITGLKRSLPQVRNFLKKTDTSR